jgi:D-inositol-3-phosphate glycosyltransferase
VGRSGVRARLGGEVPGTARAVLSPRPHSALRVALVSEHASPLATLGAVDAGGQNVHVAELAAGLTRLGHEVTVYTRRDDPGLATSVSTAAGYDVVHLSAGPAGPLAKDELWPHLPEFARELGRWFDLTRPDVAHAHFWMSAWATSRAAGSRHMPWFVTFHALGTVKQRHQGAADTSPAVRQHVERALVQGDGRVIATCSDEVAELTRLGGDPHRIAVVPCGVDLQRFTPSDSEGGRPASAPPGSAGAAAPTPERPFRVVSVGRLVPRKGFDLAIRALADVPAAELLIAGGPPAADLASHPEARRLTDLAVEVGVADRVRLLGQVDHEDVPALLRSADVVVCSPWYEPFGIVPLEAMACGVPVIATAVGGLLDTVVDGVSGRRVPPQDATALARELNALRLAPERRAAYRRTARHLAESRYSWARVAQRTAALYSSAVAPSERRLATQPASP